jgi:hypothetical protein
MSYRFRLIEIVHCYVPKTIIGFYGDINELESKFINAGFTRLKLNGDKLVLTRGDSIVPTFDYDSEAIEMRVIIEKIGNEQLKISVGNSGFPFEPLLMKKKFIRNLESYVRQIKSNEEIS